MIHSSQGSASLALFSLARVAARFIALVAIWHNRASQRRNLRELDEVTLRDLGLTRSDAMLEGEKLFWRC
jgi:uncharacterized protein YjiS (DUF1127 family)